MFLRCLITLILLASTSADWWEGEIDRDDLSHWVTDNVRADIRYDTISHDSHTPCKPGEEIYFDFTFLRRGVISLKLVRIDGEPVLIYEETKNVSEGTHVHWAVELPPENPAIYGFGALIYDEEGNWTIPWVVKIVVPAQQLTAEWSLDKEEYHDGEHPIWTLNNYGITRVTFGMEYWYEKKVDDRWVRIPGDNRVWLSIENYAEPNSTWNESLDLFMVTSGDYRFCKVIEIDGTNIREAIYMEFSFIENPWRVSRFIFPVAVVVIICVLVVFYRHRMSNRARESQ